jgi:hypothetical protein
MIDDVVGKGIVSCSNGFAPMPDRHPIQTLTP